MKILKAILVQLVPILVFLTIAAFYFSPQLRGKILEQDKELEYRYIAKESIDFKNQTGETALWTNSLYGGMPAYSINTLKDGNFLTYLDQMLSLGFKGPIGYFLIAMISFYVLMLSLGQNKWLSMIGAVAFSFCSINIALIDIGYNNELKAIAYLPLVLSGFILIFKQKYIIGALLFSTGLGLHFLGNHLQMTYFLGFILGLFIIIQLFKDFKSKQLLDFTKALLIVLIGVILAVGSSAVNLLPKYTYGNDSVYGNPVLEASLGTNLLVNAPGSSYTSGWSWEDAMKRSNGYLDILSGFIPRLVGGGSVETVDKNSAVAKSPDWKNIMRSNELTVPLYWGNLPKSYGPNYFGAIMIILFIMGLGLLKGPVKWWLALGVLFTIILSMGKNMAYVNHFLFDYFPLFNKFKNPNAILSITSLLICITAILTLSHIFQNKKNTKAIKINLLVALSITSLIALIYILMGAALFDFTSPNDPAYPTQFLTPLVETRQAYMRSDAIRSLALVLLAGALIWAFIQYKINQKWIMIGLALLVIFDMFTIGNRYLKSSDFVTESKLEANFKPREVDKRINTDPSLHFRVYDETVKTFDDAKASYFHKSLGGYHVAKLQRYQDIIDHHLAKGNQYVVNMLNTKYIIQKDENDQPTIRQNPGAKGNAWFVERFKMVENANEEIETLNEFQPHFEAIVHKEFSDYVAGYNSLKDGSINLTEYKPNHLTYQSESGVEQFAVFSEVWYGPNKGWQAYIDGQPVEHIRVNYILRGLRIPAGNHKIEFKFEPQSYYTGKAVSTATSLLIILALLGWGGYKGYQRIQEIPNETPAEKPVTPVRQKPTKTQATRSKKKGRKRDRK